MPVDLGRAAATFAAREAAAHAWVQERATRLRQRLPDAAALLRAEYGATRVWHFGSLAAGTPHAESDVDLAVDQFEGAYFTALSRLVDLFGAEVDLVVLPTATDSLRERILAEGVPL